MAGHTKPFLSLHNAPAITIMEVLFKLMTAASDKTDEYSSCLSIFKTE